MRFGRRFTIGGVEVEGEVFVCFVGGVIGRVCTWDEGVLRCGRVECVGGVKFKKGLH